MEKIQIETLEQKLKRIAEENNWSVDEVEQEKQFINFNGKDVELVGFDGDTLETSFFITYRDEEGYVACFETNYSLKQKVIKRLVDSGLGEQIKRYTLENYKTEFDFQKLIKQQAENYINNPNGWFVVLGQSGSGKSHICTAIAVSLVKHKYKLKYMLWIEEMNKLKYSRKENMDLFDEYAKADILYIDDLFKTKKGDKPTKTDVEIAFQILDSRYRQNKLTIISSELDETQLDELDRAIYRRITERTNNGNLIAIANNKANDMSLRYKKEKHERGVSDEDE